VYELNKFNIIQPNSKSSSIDINELDIIIVPLLAFNSKGYRLGQGGGFYDRALADFSNLKIGLCNINQKDNNWQYEKHDIKLDIIITEENSFFFNDC